MQTLLDFLNFKFFIAPYVLIFSYAFGAIFVPIFSWGLAVRIKNKSLPFSKFIDQGADKIIEHTKPEYLFRFYMLVLFLFISLEIVWRVIFEFLVAYFEMYDVLVNVEHML